MDEIESYCRSDAELLDCLYRPNGANSGSMANYISYSRNWLYRFIGSSRTRKNDSGHDALHDIRHELTKIYPKIQERLGEGNIAQKKDWIPYAKYLEVVAQTEVVTDIIRITPQEGFSFRIPEALFLNRKILTDRSDIVNEPFYSKERVFIIGKDDISGLRNFLEAEIYPLPESTLNLYDTRLWWTDRDPRLN